MDGYCPPFSDTPTFDYGEPSDCSDVRFIKFRMDDAHVIALFCPGEKDNPWRRFRDERGEGFMFCEFKVDDVDAAYAELGEAIGVDQPYHFGLYPKSYYSLADTQDALGFQLNFTHSADYTAQIAEATGRA